MFTKKALFYASACILPFLAVSCSPNLDNAETATQVADGTLPPWLADSEQDGRGSYTEVNKNAPYQASNQSSSSSSKTYTKKQSSTKPTASRSTGSKSKSSATAKTRTKKPTFTVYTVKKGDAVEKIARRYGTTQKALMSANGMKSDLIRIGQKLKVPKK